jgi:catechol 2,3-dioxygenase-like lactoylglutathione lyase family enzyme
MTFKTRTSSLDVLHHMAIPVHDVARAVHWYRSQFRVRVGYQDDTWALLEFANTRLALVIPAQHPPHIGVVHPTARAFGTLTTHRDGTASVYVSDSEGNAVEILEDNEHV